MGVTRFYQLKASARGERMDVRDRVGLHGSAARNDGYTSARNERRQDRGYQRDRATHSRASAVLKTEYRWIVDVHSVPLSVVAVYVVRSILPRWTRDRWTRWASDSMDALWSRDC